MDQKQAWELALQWFDKAHWVILKRSLIWKSLADKTPWWGQYEADSAPQMGEERPTQHDADTPTRHDADTPTPSDTLFLLSRMPFLSLYEKLLSTLQNPGPKFRWENNSSCS